jgi:hypothetical protein
VHFHGTKLDLGLVGSEILLLPAHLYLGTSVASSVAEKRSDGDLVMVDLCCPIHPQLFRNSDNDVQTK